jgi:hypothetical protein
MVPPIYVKKILGIGTWETHKEILDWILDGITRTLTLPQAKCNNMLEELNFVCHSKSIPTNYI